MRFTLSSNTRFALHSLLVLLAGCMIASVAQADSDNSTSVIYTESNIGVTGQNSILAFRRDANGRMSALPGSPFLTQGRGVFDTSLSLGPFDSDQNIVVNPERTLLFAVNSGSNTIAVFNILADGTLQHVQGSPFPSGGSNPVSVGLSRDTLVVVNKAMDPQQGTASLPNYTSFRVTPEGQLLPVPLSSIAVAAGNSPSQALVSPSKRLVFGADFLGGLLQSFAVEDNGALTQNPPQPPPASVFAVTSAPHLPLGLTAHPNRPIVYVGFVTVNEVGVYTYDAEGELSFIRAVRNTGAGTCWVRSNLDGTRLYTSNTGDGTISVYDITDPLVPNQVQKLQLRGIGNPFQLELDPHGGYLYVITQRADMNIPVGEGNTLHALKINPDGRLSETGGSPVTLTLPPGTRPQGLAVF